jgi:aspartyl protease family protein
MKFSAFIGITLAVGLAVGWMAPDGSDLNSAPETASEGSPAQLEVMQRDQWLAGETVLPRADDGHFYAEVTVDGASAHMLVDTGATVIALTGDDAEAIGLTWSDSDLRPVARGANGTVYGIPVTLGLVQLGEFEVKNVEATVVPEGLDISLLGQSFLSKINKVEMEQDRMVLGG